MDSLTEKIFFSLNKIIWDGSKQTHLKVRDTGLQTLGQIYVRKLFVGTWNFEKICKQKSDNLRRIQSMLSKN